MYIIDVYTGASILTREFDTLGPLCEYIFEIDSVNYQNINIYKNEKDESNLVDFTGVRVYADGVRAIGEGEGEGH